MTDLLQSMERSENVRVLMLPWLAHGHVSPFLELGKRLSCRGFAVYLCSTPVNLGPFKTAENGGVELLQLHLPELPQLPAHLHTTRNLPPHLMSDLKNAVDLAEPSFCRLLDSIRPDLVLYDLLHPWVADAAAARGIPAVLFLVFSCASFAFIGHVMKRPGPVPFEALLLEDEEVGRFRRWLAPSEDGLADGDRATDCINRSSEMVLIKSSREIEGKYVDYLSRLWQKEYVPAGLLTRSASDNVDGSRFSARLDERPPSSVAFVSFGSEFFMSKEELAEVARGLELSGVGFIWVVRFPKEEEVPLEDALPEGFLERNSSKGMIVEGWASQERILTHSAVGAFVSHCGWSSVLEALEWGVPLVPMTRDREHPLNGKLAVELGVAVEVTAHVSNEGERSYRGEDLGRALRTALSGELSEKLKTRNKEMKELLRRNGDAEMDVAAARLKDLVAKFKRE